MERALQEQFALILLDLMLPGKDGMAICRDIRQKVDIPILMVTARIDDIYKVRGLGLGADDYITKPFSPTEMVARVKSHIARYARLTKNNDVSKTPDEFDFGDLRIDHGAHRVYLDDNEIILTNKEYELLYFLAGNKEVVFSKEQLYDKIWGEDVYGELKTVTVHINRLREKIEKNPSKPLRIQTVWGAGYRFVAEIHDNNNKRNTDTLRLNELNKQLVEKIEKLEALIITDELTKINNKRSFLEYMNLIWEHCRGQHLHLSAIMIDIDNFKKYNDSLGHLEGDNALIAVAQCLKNQLKRETDFVARFGGEEFVCLLPFVEKDEAFAFAKKLVQSVENMRIPHPKNDSSKFLTISAGMANIVPSDGSSSGELLEMADKALYAAKKSGRNRVVAV
jgi:diguanylate cyclase (GGDEF)-like protein